MNRDQVPLFGCRSELGKRRCCFQNVSPIKKGRGTYGPAAFQGDNKKNRGAPGRRARGLVFTELYYLITAGHISLLEQRHHQFLLFNPLIFTNLFSMEELI